MINENMKKEVDELGLSYRSYSRLIGARINTIGDLVTKTESDLLRLRGFGKKSLKEVRDILLGMGLALRAPNKPPRRLRPNTEVVRAADRFVGTLPESEEHIRSHSDLVAAVLAWRKTRST